MLITLVQETDTDAKRCTGVGAYIRGQVTKKHSGNALGLLKWVQADNLATVNR